ncbi:MAG: Lrp/AsnC family transcriptional regulator [Candidatus Puniceispirillum sp.]|nr:Lrp/AsnC family transcriptional regulator [Candidatus Puniceispirillum sp.]MBL6774390.1 Lrp/AsnC family transcriptional regulator [Candidatus Puniceispirillum sp.]
MEGEMDRIDRSILTALQDNARISNVDLANQVGLSPSACLRRVAHLENSGVIDGYHAKLDAAKMGHDVLVLLHITLKGQSAEMMAEFEAAVAKIPQVLACFLIAGESDYILRVAARDVNDFGRVHSTYLSALPHVLRMESNFVLREVMNRTMPPNHL